MAACSDQIQLITAHAIDQQPVRLDVTFPTAGIISRQQMIPIFCRQGGRYAQRVDCCLQKGQVKMPFLTKLHIPPESGGCIQ